MPRLELPFFTPLVAFILIGCTSKQTLTSTRRPASDNQVTLTHAITKAPIDELFQIMLGRNATDSEANHYAELINDGLQVAYFEPYPTPFHETMVCGWVAASAEQSEQGIPYLSSQEWQARFGNPGFSVSALYKTVFGKFPIWQVSTDFNSNDPHALGFWVARLKQIAAQNPGENPFQRLSLEMQQALPREVSLDGKLVANVIRRQLNREPNFKNCSLNMPNPPETGTDCYFLNGLATGSIAIVDVIHFVRSTTEYIRRNINPSCYLKIFPNGLPADLMVSVNPGNLSPLANQHAIGESISEIYRVLLSRYPTPQELNEHMRAYSGGNTRVFLRKIARELQDSQ